MNHWTTITVDLNKILCLASSHLLPTVHILNTSLSHYPFHPNSTFPLPILINHPLNLTAP